MGKQYDITLAVKGKDDGGAETVRKAGKEVETFAQKIKLANKEARLSGDMALEKSLRGPEQIISSLARVAGLGEIGIGLAVAKAASQELTRMAEKIREVKEAWKDLHNGDGAFEIVKAIPIIGEVAEGVHSLVSLWSDTGESTAEATKRVQEYALANKKLADWMKEEHSLMDQGANLRLQALNSRENAANPAQANNPEKLAADAAYNDFDSTRENLRKRKAELEKERDDLALQGPSRESERLGKQDLIDQIDKNLTDNDARYKAKQQENDAVFGMKRADQAKATEGRVQDGQAKLAEAGLRARGRILDAEIAARSQKEADDIRALDKEAEDERRAGTWSVDQEKRFAALKRQVHQESNSDILQLQKDGDDRLASLQSEARAAYLESQGHHLEAVQEKILGSYDARIKAAKTTAEKESLILLENIEWEDAVKKDQDEKQRTADEADQKEREAARLKQAKDPHQFIQLSRGYEGIAARQHDHAQEALGVSKNIADTLRQILAKMGQVNSLGKPRGYGYELRG